MEVHSQETDRVVRRRRVTQESPPEGRTTKGRTTRGRAAKGGAAKGRVAKGGAVKGGAVKGRVAKAEPRNQRAKRSKASGGRGSAAHSPDAVPATSKAASAAGGSITDFLVRPSADGPKVRLGILWFLSAVAALVIGRWATTALWAATAVLAAWQVARAWLGSPRAGTAPSWTGLLAASAAAVMVAAAGVGTSLAGLALLVVPLAQVGIVMASGRKPAAAGVAVIGSVLASVPALSVVLVARNELWAALFLVVAVSFYDAGYFTGAVESSSRLEGPVTGGIGLLAVTFAASAFEAAPFNRATAWIAGVLMLAAAPLGQMLTASELPDPGAEVPAMRRLDAYLVAAPLMLVAVWTLS